MSDTNHPMDSIGLPATGSNSLTPPAGEKLVGVKGPALGTGGGWSFPHLATVWGVHFLMFFNDIIYYFCIFDLYFENFYYHLLYIPAVLEKVGDRHCCIWEPLNPFFYLFSLTFTEDIRNTNSNASIEIFPCFYFNFSCFYWYLSLLLM